MIFLGIVLQAAVTRLTQMSLLSVRNVNDWTKVLWREWQELNASIIQKDGRKQQKWERKKKLRRKVNHLPSFVRFINAVVDMLSHGLKQWLSTWWEGRANPGELRCMQCSWVTGSQDPPLPRPHLRVGSGEVRESCWRSLHARVLLEVSSFFSLFLGPGLLCLDIFLFAVASDCATLLLILCFPSGYNRLGDQ